MNYALISDGVVENVIWLHEINAYEFQNAVAMGDVPAAIGDTYADGAFYRNGERVLTIAEQMHKETVEMKEALALLGVNADEQMA